jgi:hypothetical protein
MNDDESPKTVVIGDGNVSIGVSGNVNNPASVRIHLSLLDRSRSIGENLLKEKDLEMLRLVNIDCYNLDSLIVFRKAIDKAIEILERQSK